jgi:hypothetical protein
MTLLQFRMTAKQQRICDLITLGKVTKEIAFEVGAEYPDG